MSIKVDLSIEEINVALAGLGELPAKTSFGVINKIKAQAEEQLQFQEMQKAAEQQLLVDRQKESEQQLLLEQEGTNNGNNS